MKSLSDYIFEKVYGRDGSIITVNTNKSKKSITTFEKLSDTTFKIAALKNKDTKIGVRKFAELKNAKEVIYNFNEDSGCIVITGFNFNDCKFKLDEDSRDKSGLCLPKCKLDNCELDYSFTTNSIYKFNGNLNKTEFNNCTFNVVKENGNTVDVEINKPDGKFSDVIFNNCTLDFSNINDNCGITFNIYYDDNKLNDVIPDFIDDKFKNEILNLEVHRLTHQESIHHLTDNTNKYFAEFLKEFGIQVKGFKPVEYHFSKYEGKSSWAKYNLIYFSFRNKK